MNEALAAGYHDEGGLSDALADLATTAGPQAQLRTIGASVLGRPIEALTVSTSAPEPAGGRGHGMIIGSIHGNEVIASEVALAIGRHLVQRGHPALDDADVTIVASVNPDARARSLATLDGPWWSIPPRTNANGVDLNRNWPMVDGATPHWLPWAGTGRRWLPWYRGPHPESEPEVRALSTLLAARPPQVLLNLHSVGEIVTYPWSSFAHPPAHHAELAAMAAAFNDGLERAGPFRAKQSNAWYPIVGSSNDHVYDTYGTFPLTVELSRLAEAVADQRSRVLRAFWWSNPPDPQGYAASVVEACLAALRTGLLAHPDR